MSEETVFASATPEAAGVAPSISSVPTEAAEFVGEGKKYASVEDALKSVPHAQKHIQTLEQELAQARDELSKRRTAEELLSELKSSIPSGEQTTRPVEFDASKVNDIVTQALEQREGQREAKKNVDTVISSFKDKFGDGAEQVFIELAKESGLSIPMLNRLAATSPTAVLKLAGIESKPSITNPSTNGSVNTQALNKNVNDSTKSARVPRGASTKDLVAAWHVAGEKVKQAN